MPTAVRDRSGARQAIRNESVEAYVLLGGFDC
jgi:hypothetical protein